MNEIFIEIIRKIASKRLDRRKLQFIQVPLVTCCVHFNGLHFNDNNIFKWKRLYTSMHTTFNANLVFVTVSNLLSFFFRAWLSESFRTNLVFSRCRNTEICSESQKISSKQRAVFYVSLVLRCRHSAKRPGCVYVQHLAACNLICVLSTCSASVRISPAFI